MLGHRGLALEIGDHDGRTGTVADGAIDLEPVRDAALEAVLVEPDRLLVRLHRAPGDVQLEIQLPQEEVGGGHIGHQGDDRRPPPLLGGEVGGEGRLLLPPDAAEEVDLPGDGDAGAVVLVRLAVHRALRGLREPGDLLRRVPAGDADLGEQERAGDAVLGPGLRHARGGRPQVEVVGDRLADQDMELGVLDDLPPGEIGEGLRLGLAFEEAVRRRGRGHLGPAVVGTHGTARNEGGDEGDRDEPGALRQAESSHVSAPRRELRRVPCRRGVPRACPRRSASRPPRTTSGPGRPREWSR